MKHTPHPALAASALVLALSALPANAATTVLVSENFDSMRLNADDPTREDLRGAGWYSWNSNTNGGLWGVATAPTGMSGRVAAASGSSANSYLYTQWGDVSLSNVGDSITVTLASRASAAPSNAANPFEFAFLDSSTVISSNSLGGTDPMATASGFSYRINNTGEALLAYTSGTASTLTSDATAPAVFDTTVRTFSFSVTLTGADTAQIRLAVNGVDSLTFDQSVSGSIDFNTLRLRTSTGAQFDNISVVHTAAIPEPSSAAALAGLATLGLVATRRRRSK